MAALLPGCGPTDGERFQDLTKQINRLKVEKIELEEQITGRDGEIAALESQLQNLRTDGLAPPEPMFQINEIEILDITSGTNTDGAPGDDAVSVYFRPIDRDGDALKRGGAIRIKLLDNDNADRPTLLGLRVDSDPEQIRKAWHGQFWTDYYKIDVPFTPNAKLRPGQEVDVHLTFLDRATGRKHTALKAVTINRRRPARDGTP